MNLQGSLWGVPIKSQSDNGPVQLKRGSRELTGKPQTSQETNVGISAKVGSKVKIHQQNNKDIDEDSKEQSFLILRKE